MNPSYDVIIIGAGPAGSSAAIYTARAGLRTLVIDRSAELGALHSATAIVNYPGIPSTSGADLVARMREQAMAFGAVYVEEPVVSADGLSTPKVVLTDRAYQGRALILASGAHERKNKLPGEAELLGRGVSYCATCDAAFFRGQPVAVVGNNEYALEEAAFLARFASRVTLVTSRQDLPAGSAKVDVLHRHVARSVLGDRSVEGLRVTDLENGQESDIAARGVFIYLEGAQASTSFLGPDFPLGEGACLHVDREMRTPVEGVFAAGDVTCFQLKQAVVAAAQGVIAAISTDRYLNKLSEHAAGRYW